MVLAISYNVVDSLPVVAAQDHLGSSEDLKYDSSEGMNIQVVVVSNPDMLSVFVNDVVRTV